MTLAYGWTLRMTPLFDNLKRSSTSVMVPGLPAGRGSDGAATRASHAPTHREPRRAFDVSLNLAGLH